MNRLITLLLLSISSFSFGQTEVFKKYQMADTFMQSNNFKAAYNIFKDLETKCDKKDTLYSYILWGYASSATQIEKTYRNDQQFDSSLFYGLEALKIIEQVKPYFDEKFASREYFMTKNVNLVILIISSLLFITCKKEGADAVLAAPLTSNPGTVSTGNLLKDSTLIAVL